MPELIYLDGFATLPLAPEAREAMLEAWQLPGNGGSPNRSGERAARILESGREAVATLIGAAPAEIVFTSGATEANNLALLGVTEAIAGRDSKRRRVIVSAIEHKSVLEPARALERRGLTVSIAPVDCHGRLDLERFAALLGDDVLLASVMLANNETGVIQPVREAAALAHEAGALFHCDAAQAAGKIVIDVIALDIDYLSLSAHKCHGPMGIGALYVAAGTPNPAPLVHGGGQQRAIRPGTEPVALVAGFGAAARAAAEALARPDGAVDRRMAALLDALANRQLRFSRVTDGAAVLPGSAAIMIEGVDGDALCAAVATHVSISTGSACTSGQLTTSHVLDAMGFSSQRARSVVRLLCDRYTPEPQIEAAAAHIVAAAARSRLAAGDVRQ